MLKKVGYNVNPKMVKFVPINASSGFNILKKFNKKNMKWYRGPTLIEAIDLFRKPKLVNNLDQKPLRIAIESTHCLSGVGTVACGRIETGKLKTTPPIDILVG